MNILLVADVSVSKIIGGAERVLYEQATRLVRRGHKVCILTRRMPDHDQNHEIIEGVNEYRYSFNNKNSLKFLCSSRIYSKKLFEALHQKDHFDCINFHQPFSATGVINSTLSVSIPKIYTCHSLSFEEFLSRNRNGSRIFSEMKNYMKSRGYKKIEKNILNKSNEIVVLSEFTKGKIKNIHKISDDMIKVIPGGVDLNRFTPAMDKKAIRQKLNIPNDKITLFTVRNLVQRMGIENLLIAFNDLVKQNAEINLVIGGEGKLKTGLIALARSFGIEDQIRFVGFIPEERLPSYYQMADLFILPTKELEGFGLVTLEALATGLPVLGTPVGGTKEILGGLEGDFIFENTEPQSISKKILEKYIIIKENSQMWEEIRQRCRKFVERNYSWEKNIDAIEALFINMSQN